MKITFSKPKHESLVNDHDALCKKFNKKGQSIADNIILTMDALIAADSLADLPPSFRPHPLKGEYKGCFAADVTNTHRVIFQPNHDKDPNFRIDNPKTIKSILILEIFEDYHK